ncbi:MAG: EamA family transporter [Chloroflexota bacterium]
MSKRPVSPLAIWIGIVTLWVVWGSTYLAIRVAVGSLPPFLMAGMRFVTAGAVLVPLVWAFGRGSVRLPNRREALDAAIVGAFLLIGGMGVVSWSETMVPSGIAALLVALMPMWPPGIFARAIFGERMARGAVVGTIVGLAGVALLVGPTIAGGGAEARADRAPLLADGVGAGLALRRATTVLPKPALMASGTEGDAAGRAAAARGCGGHRRVRRVLLGGRLGRGLA